MREKGSGHIQGVAKAKGRGKSYFNENKYQAYSKSKAGTYAGQSRAKAAQNIRKGY